MLKVGDQFTLRVPKRRTIWQWITGQRPTEIKTFIVKEIYP